MSRTDHVIPSAGRATVSDLGNRVSVVIPPVRGGPVGFLSLWLAGWLVGEILVLNQVVGMLTAWWAPSGDSGTAGSLLVLGFLSLWLTAWTYGGYLAIRTWLWLMYGYQHIFATADHLEIKLQLFGKSRGKLFDAASIRNLRISSDRDANIRTGQFASLEPGVQGVVAFDYGADTLYFASSIEEGEADLLREHVEAKLNAS